MARIKINLPEKFLFSVDIPIRVSDINLGGHLSWDSMFRILDEARTRFWKHIDYSETENKRISNIMMDAGIQYKKQAYHGQTLRVEVGVTEISARDFDLVYRVSEIESGDEVARAKSGILCYDYEEQKVISIPDKLLKKISV